MKIEIGESLILSWLRHVHGCLAVQMNWKPSPTWLRESHDLLFEQFQAVRAWSAQLPGLRVFKQGEWDQIVRQTEIDLVGLRLARGGDLHTIFAVDSAFHENGLQYGDPSETVGRVLKKLIRAAFVLKAHTPVGERRIIFAAPKVQASVEASVQHHLSTLEADFASNFDAPLFGCRFEVIANQRFADEILRPVLSLVDRVADTSELFLRAQQLLRTCGAVTPHSIRSREALPRQRSTTVRADGKIGQHVRIRMAEFAAAMKLTPPVVQELLDAQYCKATFRLAHPFLKRFDPAIGTSAQTKDERGYGRYWKEPLGIAGHQFLMCSQWFDWQRDAFDRWAAKL